MRRPGLWVAAAVTACALIGFWWDAGHGQTWVAVHTGTDYCASLPPGQALTTCRSYGFWSGFGSVIPWSLFSMGGIFAGLVMGLRHVNCHEPGCWRMGKYPLAGGEFKVCGKHNPDFEGKHPRKGQIAARHREYQEKLHLFMGKQPGKG